MQACISRLGWHGHILCVKQGSIGLTPLRRLHSDASGLRTFMVDSSTSNDGPKGPTRLSSALFMFMVDSRHQTTVHRNLKRHSSAFFMFMVDFRLTTMVHRNPNGVTAASEGSLSTLLRTANSIPCMCIYVSKSHYSQKPADPPAYIYQP